MSHLWSLGGSEGEESTNLQKKIWKKKTSWKNENVHYQNLMLFHAILSLCSSAKKRLVVTDSLIHWATSAAAHWSASRCWKKWQLLWNCQQLCSLSVCLSVCERFTDSVQQTPLSAGFLQQRAPVSQKHLKSVSPKTSGCSPSSTESF